MLKTRKRGRERSTFDDEIIIFFPPTTKCWKRKKKQKQNGQLLTITKKNPKNGKLSTKVNKAIDPAGTKHMAVTLTNNNNNAHDALSYYLKHASLNAHDAPCFSATQQREEGVCLTRGVLIVEPQVLRERYFHLHLLLGSPVAMPDDRDNRSQFFGVLSLRGPTLTLLNNNSESWQQ